MKEYFFKTLSFQLIQDANLSDRKCFIILRKLRRHWKGAVPSYIPRVLRDKKRKLDHLYSLVIIMP